MIKPDLVVVWPRAFDFPYFREFITRNRDLFNQVIISFTHNSVDRDYRKFLKATHPDFTFVDSIKNKDWYDDAINEALNAVKSEWVLFMEQDFVCTRDTLKYIFLQSEPYNFVSFLEGNRLHLCCTLARMEIVNKTLRYFGTTQRYGLDCFDLFMLEMEVLSKGKYATLGEIVPTDYYHLSGLTHNYHLVDMHLFDLVTGKERFKQYNKMSMDANIIKHPSWIEIMKGVDKI